MTDEADSWTDDFDTPEAVLVARWSLLQALKAVPIPAQRMTVQDYNEDTGEPVGEPYDVTVTPSMMISGRLR